jgi:hypothetical protein
MKCNHSQMTVKSPHKFELAGRGAFIRPSDRMKKLLSVVAVLAVVALSVAGCKNEQAPVETPEVPTPEMPSTNAPAAN